MDLRSFLALERENLTEERERLKMRSPKYINKGDSLGYQMADCAQLEPTNNTRQRTKHANSTKVPSESSGEKQRETFAVDCESLNGQCLQYVRSNDSFGDQLVEIALCEKPTHSKGQRPKSAPQTRIEKHDMDQWISDTFYSHFPGFNNEYQNRQLYIQKRQKENEENLLKHQMLHAAVPSRKSKHVRPAKEQDKPTVDSGASSTTSNGTIYVLDNQKPLDVNTKVDSFILLRDESLSSARSGSSRYKHMQDLRHTNLANMLNRSNEDEIELNRKRAEIETARKKQYQQELMQQIEEKRRTIKNIKDKEVQQEKVLTRRLEEQLKTMKLEEKLEKERLKATKIRYAAEQNQLLREHLLLKLENDTKLLQDSAIAKKMADNETNKENITLNSDNKVYKYFSNSEKHEYNLRKKSAIPADIDLAVGTVDLPKIERECFHLSEKICPGCDEPLREFDDFCLRCQTRNSKSLKTPPTEESTHTGHNSSADSEFGWIASERARSFHLACMKCERFYKLCSTCLQKSDVCKACQNKRNICMNCRRTLCSFCLEEVACGKDAERLHVNESERRINSKTDSQNEDYVQVLSFNGGTNNDIDNKSAPLSLQPSESRYLSINNLNVVETPTSLSPKNGRVSIFRESNNVNMPKDYNVEFLQNDNNKDFENEEANIERLRRDTDTRLSRYLENYKELAFYSRGTQTTPNSTARRDIVLSGEQSLSIPLLREMPRMTRNETVHSKKPYSDDIENLKRRWEIPAVQKQSVSRTSPKVITQIGAVRRQLQTEKLFADDTLYKS